LSEDSTTPVSRPVAAPHDKPNAETDGGPSAVSALRGHLDYLELAERLSLGVTTTTRNDKKRRGPRDRWPADGHRVRGGVESSKQE
jgi:hypothetical protein